MPSRDLGKYGHMRLRYLQDHKSELYAALLMEGRLFAHLLLNCANHPPAVGDLCRLRGLFILLYNSDGIWYIMIKSSPAILYRGGVFSMARIQCVVERITYQNPDNGYSVLKAE